MKSNFARLDLSDFHKGIIMAALSAASGGIIASIEAGTWLTYAVWASAAKTGAIAAFSYFVKNLFTNSKDQFGVPER